MSNPPERRLDDLSRLIITPPPWPLSIATIVLLGLAVEAMSALGGWATTDTVDWFGVLGYMAPGLASAVLGARLVPRFRRTPDWPALIAGVGTVLLVIVSLLPAPLVFPGSFPGMYAIATGVVFGFDLLVLAVIADRRLSRVLLPALAPAAVGTFALVHEFGPGTAMPVVAAIVVSGFLVLAFARFIERPVKAAFGLPLLALSNAFAAHLISGSRQLDDCFERLGEEVVVFQASIHLLREHGPPITVTVPNLHPGPLGEIGSSNLPAELAARLGQGTFVLHGCATHDFNLVSSNGIETIAVAVEGAVPALEYRHRAGPAVRVRTGTVEVLVQPFGDAVLAVATRSPLTTDDLDYGIGLAVQRGRHPFAHVAFADAHNCMHEVPPPVEAASPLGTEYIAAVDLGLRAASRVTQGPLKVGVGHRPVPFGRREGFGELGVQVLAVRAGEHTTAWVLIDGNNLLAGIREEVRAALLERVDECELLTTDTHVVNTLSGRNPVGLAVPVEQFLPYVLGALDDALDDLGPAGAAGSTVQVDGIRVFGYGRVGQLGTTAAALVSMLGPASGVLLAIGLLSTLGAYLLLA